MPKKLILLIGAPGSGKTTDATIIAKNHADITSYSLGELLKDEAKKDTKTGKISRVFLEKGELVPTGIVLDTICGAIQNSPTQIVLIDGFPRKEKQMKLFGDLVADINRVDLYSVIEIRVSRKVAKARVKSLGNFDEDIFCNSMEIYQNTIEDIEKFYNKDGLLKVIDGERESSAVIADINTFLKEQIELTPA